MTKKKDKSTLDEFEAGLQREREAQAEPVSFGDPAYDEPDVSDEEKDQNSVPDGHKEYTVHLDGTVINGELLNEGDVVTLHPDVARQHTDAGVRLTEVKSDT